MFAVFIVNSIIVALAVLIHYEFLMIISNIMPKIKIKNRSKILVGVFSALIAHTAEIWVFGIAYFFMNKRPTWGDFAGNFNDTLLDCVYFSFTSFTSLGLGDIEPHGAIRYLAGIEALTGLVLITWTASFLYYEMQRFWGKN